MAQMFGLDAYSPGEIAERVEAVGVAKARLPLLSLCMLGVLAGAFIGLGAMFYVLVTADEGLGFAASRVLGGLTFSLGLILVVVAGAELFTGNNLLAMAWTARKITIVELIRNWVIVCLTNFVGAVGLVALVYLSGHTELNGGRVAEQYVRIAAAKCALPFWSAFFKGVLCNVLVCMAIWMAMAGRSLMDKAVAIVFPITAFVAAGFEHSVANMYLIPMGILLKSSGQSATVSASLDGWGLLSNIIPVIAGNLVGGSVLVALVYYVIYRRGARDTNPGASGKDCGGDA